MLGRGPGVGGQPDRKIVRLTPTLNLLFPQVGVPTGINAKLPFIRKGIGQTKTKTFSWVPDTMLS